MDEMNKCVSKTQKKLILTGQYTIKLKKITVNNMSFSEECCQKVKRDFFSPHLKSWFVPMGIFLKPLWKTCCANYLTILIFYSIFPIYITLLSFKSPFRENFVQKENKMNNNAFF